ncbi:hypothetical protein V1478_006900 [Vespula squamosa]|uniref:Uncharacterized protein n=1 Tax=Vespula squamosa TaxID=30214 RepID=A0ABD2B1N8_VESSQ
MSGYSISARSVNYIYRGMKLKESGWLIGVTSFVLRFQIQYSPMAFSRIETNFIIQQGLVKSFRSIVMITYQTSLEESLRVIDDSHTVMDAEARLRRMYDKRCYGRLETCLRSHRDISQLIRFVIRDESKVQNAILEIDYLFYREFSQSCKLYFYLNKNQLKKSIGNHLGTFGLTCRRVRIIRRLRYTFLKCRMLVELYEKPVIHPSIFTFQQAREQLKPPNDFPMKVSREFNRILGDLNKNFLCAHYDLNEEDEDEDEDEDDDDDDDVEDEKIMQDRCRMISIKIQRREWSREGGKGGDGGGGAKKK